MAVAFFDLDKTLISRNSASLWIRSELRGGHITRRIALRGMGYIVQYHLGMTQMEHALRYAVSILTGLREADIVARTRAFYEAEVAQLYRPGAREAVERHRAAGDRLVLCTTSSSYLSEAVCAELDLETALCNRFEVDDDGRYTGRAFEPLCFGPGKVALAQRWLVQNGERLEDAVFYSDSTSDLPMLEAVAHPVVVNPDVRLRRVARRRGWSLEDWGEPT